MKHVMRILAAVLCVALPTSVSSQDDGAEEQYSRLAEAIEARLTAELPVRWENLKRQRTNAETGASCDARARAAYSADFLRRYGARHQRLEIEAVERYGTAITELDFIITLGCREEPTASYRNEQLALYAANLRWFENQLGIQRFSNDELIRNRVLLRMLSNEQLYDIARNSPRRLALERWCQTRNLRRSYGHSIRMLGAEYLAELESVRQTLASSGQLLIDDSANDIVAIFHPPSTEQCRRMQHTLPLAHVALSELQRRAVVGRSPT
jgi:hypothetical protein